MNRKLYERPVARFLIFVTDSESYLTGWSLDDLEELSYRWHNEGWEVGNSITAESWQLLCPVSMMEWEDDS